eukprot:scaffold26900_cov117-Cylindrotheca_fusiformis.AAC.5
MAPSNLRLLMKRRSLNTYASRSVKPVACKIEIKETKFDALNVLAEVDFLSLMSWDDQCVENAIGELPTLCQPAPSIS